MNEHDHQEGREIDPDSGSLLQRLLRAVFSKLGAGHRGKKLAGSAAGVFTMKITAMTGAFLISVLLSRLLGVSGYGQYAYAIAWVQLLLVPALLGTDRLLVREVAALNIHKEWGTLRGLLLRSQQGVFLTSILLALILGLVLHLIEPFSKSIDTPMVIAVWVAMPLVPLFAMTRLRQTILLGLDRATLSQVPESLIQPWLLILFLVVAWLFLPGFLSPNHALLFQAGAGVVAMGYAVFQSRRYLPGHVRTAEPQFQVSVWLRSSLPILAVAGIQMINTRIDILMVGSLMGAESAGLYTVANRGAQLVLLVYFAVNAALAPTVASLWTEKNIERLQDVVRKATRVTFLGSLPIAFILIVGGRWFLLIFGEAFVAGLPALIVLCLAQLVTVFFGAVGTVLMMTGHERQAAVGAAVSALLNIGLNLLLIPKFGMLGAAWALFTGQVVASLVMAVLVKAKVGIRSSAL
ncbi:flippase [bacterium]|nr:flippase [bacterium]